MKKLGIALVCILAVVFRADPLCRQEPVVRPRAANESTESAEELLARIWKGVQEAQAKYVSGCGKITETRSSKLLTRPLVFRGSFCASGLDKFYLEYFEPDPVRLVFNTDCLNITTGRKRKNTEVLDVGDNVKRTQRYFSRSNSLKNLKENFEISVKQSTVSYEMKFVPRSQRFAQKINHVIVTLRKSDYLLNTLEIDGKNGVKSVFLIEIERLNGNIGEEVYKVYRP